MASNTDAIRRLVEDRLAELDKERHELQEALRELTEKVTGRVTGRVTGKKSPSRSKGSSRSKGASSKSGSGQRRRKGGTRADQALKVVAGNPGVKASEIAESLKIKPNYVYRVMGDLVKQGRVKKKGTGYFPA